MPKWNESMIQTYEYYKVDPNTWMDDSRITSIIDSKIDRDGGAETLGSASFTTDEMLGECYIRIYLITIQNGITERFPLGTYLVQTPSYSYDGIITQVKIDAYTPLLELKEKPPALGYFIPKDTNILLETHRLMSDHMRAPVIYTKRDNTISYDFTSDPNDTWLSYIRDFVTSAECTIDLDEMGRVLFKPLQKLESLQHVWTYDDGNSSILHPAITLDNDLYGIPNVVEVIYSTDTHKYNVRVVNKDENSPVSIQNRGREIVHRVSNPEISGVPTEAKIYEHAKKLLKDLSSLEYTITYTHGYCPTRVGDCVMLNYASAGLHNVKAKIISQSISCVPGTPVEEKAVFKDELWGL